MIAVDTNVLAYAHRREVPEHDTAVARIAALATGHARWAIPWPCLFEFFSVVTNPRIWMDSASTPAQAWEQIHTWISSPSISLLAEPQDFPAVLEPLLKRPRVRGPIVHDARVAGICLAHGVERLLSRDRDFSLFPELPIENPFVT